jgi:hydrophobic/amphiphilic exporter-1 (mainly G- bacteria), HAE1 family
MTACTLIFGVLPVALALGQGSAFRAPMARVVIGGMTRRTPRIPNPVEAA